jgi:hypothetical protein
MTTTTMSVALTFVFVVLGVPTRLDELDNAVLRVVEDAVTIDLEATIWIEDTIAG